MYSVIDVVEYQAVCAEVLSGSIAGREIEISYATTGGTQTHACKIYTTKVLGLILQYTCH